MVGRERLRRWVFLGGMEARRVGLWNLVEVMRGAPQYLVSTLQLKVDFAHGRDSPRTGYGGVSSFMSMFCACCGHCSRGYAQRKQYHHQ